MVRAYGSDYVERSRSKSSLDMLKEHIEVGAALYATGAYWRAIEQFEAALKMQPDNFNANNNIALAYMKIGETERARDHFERALQADPTAIDVSENLAELRKAGAATHGVQQIDTDSAQPLQHSLSLCALGKVYLSRNAYSQALDAFSQALDASPDDVDALNGLGTAYLARGEFEKAQAQFMKVLSLNPENETAKQKVADIEFILAALKEESKGQQSFQISLDSQIEARARYVRANELYEEGKYEEAAGEYLRACDLAPTSVEILNNLGTTYYALQRYEEAKAVLKKAHQLDPDSALINSNLGALTMALQAEKPAQMKQLEMVPESSEPRERTEAETEPTILPDSPAVTESPRDGEGALEEQRSPDRRNEGGQIHANEPEKPADSALSHLNMGAISEEGGDIEGALRHYREAVRLEPRNARAHFNLGNIYFRIGAFDSAIECYWATVEADPSFALSYNNMGVAYHRLGNHHGATLAWRRALEADPALESARENLRKFGVPETSRSEAPAE
jgi:tetratricopeptide (TPR) repeat protein